MKLKIFLIGFLSIVLCLCLTGCGAEETKYENIANAIVNEFFDENTKTAEVEGEDESYEQDSVKKIYEDNSKLIYQEGDTYMVYTFSGDRITGYSAYTEFENVAAAQIALNEYNKDPDEEVRRAYIDGNKLYFEYDETVYGDLTVSEVKLTYSLLESFGN